MVDTNALFGIIMSIIANFTNLVDTPHEVLPTKVADCGRYRVGAPQRPLDVGLTLDNGSHFFIRDGAVRNYFSADSYTQWGGSRPRSNFQGVAIMTTNQAIALAVKTVERLAKGRNPVASLEPCFSDATDSNAPFYHIEWNGTNDRGERTIPAFLEIDGRKGKVTYLMLSDKAFSDFPLAQVISNKVYTPPPRRPSDWARQFEAPLKRVEPYPTTNEVLEGINSWLRLCRKLGVDPGNQTNLESVFWPTSMVYDDPGLSRAAHVCKVQFSNHTAFSSISGVAFSHDAHDACFVGFFERMSREDRAQFRGKINYRWEDLAKGLEQVLVERVGIPRGLLSDWVPELYVQDPRKFDGLPLKRVVIGWRNRWNDSSNEEIVGANYAFQAEFDLGSGELKWIAFQDPRFVGALRVAQERERKSAESP